MPSATPKQATLGAEQSRRGGRARRQGRKEAGRGRGGPVGRAGRPVREPGCREKLIDRVSWRQQRGLPGQRVSNWLRRAWALLVSLSGEARASLRVRGRVAAHMLSGQCVHLCVPHSARPHVGTAQHMNLGLKPDMFVNVRLCAP